jgi:hypothetical protein
MWRSRNGNTEEITHSYEQQKDNSGKFSGKNKFNWVQISLYESESVDYYKICKTIIWVNWFSFGDYWLYCEVGNCQEGGSIAQAVSRRLPTEAAWVKTRVWSCGILWWTKVALGQVFSENFGFPCQSTFHLLLHNHLHYHPRLAQ